MYSMFSNSLRSGYTRPYTPVWTPYCSNQWLAAPDSDGIIADKRSILSRPSLTGNFIKRLDGVGDYLSIDTGVPAGDDGNKFGEAIATICFKPTSDTGVRILCGHGRTAYRISYAVGLGGEFNVAINGVTVSLIGGYPMVDEWHIIKAWWNSNGECIRVDIDNSTRFTGTIAAGIVGTTGTRPYYIGTRYQTSVGAFGSFDISHFIFETENGTYDMEYTFAAGPSLVEWNIRANARHGTYTTTSGIDAMATTSDNATPWNILNGFSLYTHATLPVLRVPYDINGDPLSITPPTGYTLVSEHPGGYLHNGAESGVKQTDDLFIGGTPNFYSADGETQDSKTYTDFAAHHPFDLGLLLQWEDVAGVCMLKEAIQMPFAYMWVPLWYIAALAYIQTYTAACGASPLVPDEVTPGTGIGPDLDWADNGSGKVLLVEDV